MDSQMCPVGLKDILVHTNHSAHNVVNCLIGRRDGKRLQVQGRMSRAQTSRSICFPLARWSLRLLTRLALRDAFEPREDLLGGATDGPCRHCTSRQSGSHPLCREFQGIQDHELGTGLKQQTPSR